MERQISPMAQDCLELIKKMLSGDLTTEEKYAGMWQLHKKYPGAGFDKKAEEFARNWLTDRKERPRYPED